VIIERMSEPLTCKAIQKWTVVELVDTV